MRNLENRYISPVLLNLCVNWFQGSDESMPIWYIMDEFGSRIQHSDSPTVKTSPFFFAPLQISFTLMWPLQDLEENGKAIHIYTVEHFVSFDYRYLELRLDWQKNYMYYVTYKRIKTLCVFSFVDEITRDFVPNVGDPETRKAKLIPWVPADMTDVDYFQKEPDVSFFEVYCWERERYGIL